MIRLFFYTFLAVTCSFCAWAIHHSAQDATWASRQLYPLEALLTSRNIQCQGPQQQMLAATLKAGHKQGSLTSQVAYVSPEGELSACASAPHGETPNLNARYRYASLTKLLTAQAILTTFAQQGRSLTTSLHEFVPQAATAKDERWADVTIEQLLTHSAGLDRLRSYDPMTRHAVTPWCPGNLDQLKNFPLDFTPGTDVGYSNLTYCLLGVVLERATGLPYTEAMEHIFNLSAYNMAFIHGPYLEDEVTYDFRHAGFYGENYYEYLDFLALASSAGLSGTAIGLVEWLTAQRNAQALTVTQHVWPAECDLSKKRSCYGYALFPYQKKEGDLTVQVQQGYVFGASSTLLMDEHGGIFLWLGNGSAPKGSAADNMMHVMYELLLEYYHFKEN